ncbi:MAG: LysR substrate-binding domain-containing protein [Burkholderiaceae bacterium]|jgi:DNA-binding transcriptional LysR family regulator
MQDLNDMLYFAEVVTQGGFAAAARSLGLPKSRISRRIARLETELGVRLLNRTTRKLSLTMPGELYYRHCLSIQQEAQAAAAAVAIVQSEPRGLLRVACPVTIAQTIVGPRLPQFLKKYPLVQVDLQVTNRAVNVVEEGIDVALRVRTVLEDSATLVVKHLGLTQTLLVCHPDLLCAVGTPTEPSQLNAFELVAMSVNDGRMFWQLFGPEGLQYTVTKRPCFVADDLQTLKHAIVGGVGLGVLPDYMCRQEIEAGKLVVVLPHWAPRPGIFHAVYGSRRGLVPAVRVFLDFLGETLQAGGWVRGTPE